MPDRAKIKQKLNQMKQKTWMYRTDTFTIVDYELSENFVIIITDAGYQRKPITTVLEYLNECLPVEEETRLTIRKEAEVLNTEEKATFQNVQEILIENIKKVQADPAYVNQAKVVNSSVQTMLNMVKHRIEVAKLSKYGK